MALPESDFRWNDRAARYVGPNGRFVSQSAIRQELDRALENSRWRMASLSEQLRSGSISLNDWYAEMRRLVKQVHIYSAAAAKGGWAQLSQADYGRIGQLVREQYGFLARFSTDIVEGLPLDGRYIRRVALYGEAGRRTYHKTQSVEMETRRMDEERSILNPADHCGECIEEAAKGWQPLGTIVPIGERQCKSGCKCDMEYRRAA